MPPAASWGFESQRQAKNCEILGDHALVALLRSINIFRGLVMTEEKAMANHLLAYMCRVRGCRCPWCTGET